MRQDRARKFAEAWCGAWNGRALGEIMSHYADPPEHRSPLIVERVGRADGTIRDFGELREYFGRGLEAMPTLHFELIDVLVGVAGVSILYQNQRGQHVVEVVQLDADERITKSDVYYR